MRRLCLSTLAVAVLTAFFVAGCRFIRPMTIESYPGTLIASTETTPSPLSSEAVPKIIHERTLDGRANPFLPLPEERVLIEKGSHETPAFLVSPTHDQNLSISTIRLRGIVLGEPSIAYVDDGSGALHRVTLGDPLMGGRITLINANDIVIREPNNREITLRMEESP